MKKPIAEPLLMSPCCEILTAPISEADADDMAKVFKVLADPVRLRLLSIVASAESGEVCACDLPDMVGRSQPTISHHLSALVDAGLLEREKRGKWAWFRFVPDQITALQTALTV